MKGDKVKRRKEVGHLQSGVGHLKAGHVKNPHFESYNQMIQRIVKSKILHCRKTSSLLQPFQISWCDKNVNVNNVSITVVPNHCSGTTSAP